MILFGLYGLVAAAFGIVALAFLLERAHYAVTVMAVMLLGLAPLFQGSAGVPAAATGRLHAEEWRLLSVAALADNRFIVSVRYAAGDVRTYDLTLTKPGQRDEFLKAAQALKKGRAMQGRAAHGRAGLTDDSQMDFGFSEAPELEPKEGQHP